MSGNKLYIGNLSILITEEQISELFVPYGPVTNVKLIERNDRMHYAFVTMMSGGSEAIVGLDGSEQWNNNIKVNWAYTQVLKSILIPRLLQ
jgi:RNA recognition motif-containing protein